MQLLDGNRQMTPPNKLADEAAIRKEERRKMALEGLNKLISFREAFGSKDREVLSCVQSWLNDEAR
jgi:hypothetical protein